MTTTERHQDRVNELHAERVELVAAIAKLAAEADEWIDEIVHEDFGEDGGAGGGALVERDRAVAVRQTLADQLTRVDAALARIADGTYGVCVDCGCDIPAERLEALPDAARCVRCQVHLW